VLLSLSAPLEITLLPDIATPAVLAVAEPVLMVTFFIALLAAPAPVPKEESQIPVELFDVLVFVIVRPLPPVLSPSMVTRSAPLSLIRPPAILPEIFRIAPPEG